MRRSGLRSPPLPRRSSVDGFQSRPTRSTPVSIGRVNSPRAVSGLPARKSRIGPSVASCSCSGMTSIPALVASVATRESAVRRCPCGNSACSGEPNWAIEPLFGRCAPAVSARQLLNVSRGPMAALPLIRSSPATQSTRLSKTFHRPAGFRLVRGLWLSRVPRGSCRTSAWRCRLARHRRTRPAAVSPRHYPAGRGQSAARGAVRSASPGRARLR
jgi:hypothetical protein